MTHQEKTDLTKLAKKRGWVQDDGSWSWRRGEDWPDEITNVSTRTMIQVMQLLDMERRLAQAERSAAVHDGIDICERAFDSVTELLPEAQRGLFILGRSVWQNECRMHAANSPLPALNSEARAALAFDVVPDGFPYAGRKKESLDSKERHAIASWSASRASGSARSASGRASQH